MSMTLVEHLHQDAAYRLTLKGNADTAILRRAFNQTVNQLLSDNPLSNWSAETNHYCVTCGAEQPILFRYWPALGAPHVVTLRDAPDSACEHVGHQPGQPIRQVYILAMTVLDDTQSIRAKSDTDYAAMFVRSLRQALRRLYRQSTQA